METWTLLLFISALHLVVAEGSFGDKLNSTNNENSTDSTEETLTTSEGSVMVLKSILAAEVTPEASYNLVDHPDDSTKWWDNNMNSIENNVKSQESNFGSDTYNTEYFGNRLKPYFFDNHIRNENKQEQNFKNDFTSAGNFDQSTPNVNTKSKNENSYNPYAYVDKQNSNRLSGSSYLPREKGALKNLEEERLYQIEVAKSNLKQIQLAQAYAAKVREWQNAKNHFQSFQWKPVESWENNYISSFNVPSVNQYTKSKTFSRTQTPSFGNLGYSKYNHPATIFPQVPNTFSNKKYQSWGVSSIPRQSPYSGPTTAPVILPSGYLADTEEVVQARIAHLQALQKAVKDASLWKHAEALNKWYY